MIHVSAFHICRWGFIAVVIRPDEQRVVEYRPKTHTQSTTAVGTELRSLSTSFDLPIIYRCFFRMLQPSRKPSDHWNRIPPVLCKIEQQYSLRFFCWFRKPFLQKGCGSCERWL
ncbi:hypothetical protein AVEN_53616-1 [Araneus ventricosus]|uniref:Uncharacterized protein n=1 Tax=Araneus ventricosus TaxID=182803 RepID=A0A4Y2R491_ARAVE|nr:hypothetical protein AVEN_2472-1 [Araneus ventricosus]GBN70460.1 hypothetical protein AVEN_250128-1 [Araneus ventricosus]GBN70484.1 hypothetical protein AVEN_46768-1 [Araneus ventricosus]GBN70494.1 hypothetical protein AVEN_53616-1 [Araneus ventricosus]